ncbi:MAG: ISNCY family transposase, partial [Oligoflexia bacterium]|nr:ISNCY family transposase [Oligoflexia bacterium]
LYVDRAGIFGGNNNSPVPFKREGFSQLKDRLELLGIQTIYAHTAQAKGRVERAFSTLQDRLIPEMRLRNIIDIEDATKFFNDFFLPEIFNNNFIVQPENQESAFRQLPMNLNLNDHFYVKIKRKVGNDHTIKNLGKVFDLELIERSIAGEIIEIRTYPNVETRLFWNDRELFLKDRTLKIA